MQTLNSFGQPVAVFGEEHISEKDMQIVQLMLNLPEFKDAGNWINCVVFRNDGFYPMVNLAESNPEEKEMPVFGTCNFDSKAINICLYDIFSDSMDAAERNTGFALHGYYYQLVWDTVLHELKHLYDVNRKPDLIRGMEDEEVRIKMDEDASQFAVDKLYELAKEYDMEPAAINLSPYLNEEMSALLGDPELKNEFLDTQRDLLVKRLYYYKYIDEEKEHKLATFKDFLHNMSGDAGDDDTWAKCNKALNPLFAAAPQVMTASAPVSGNEQAYVASQVASQEIINEVFDPDDNDSVVMENFCPPWENSPQPTPQYQSTPAPAPQTQNMGADFNQPPQNQMPQNQWANQQQPMQQYAAQTQPASSGHNKDSLVRIEEQDPHVRWIINVYYKLYNHIFHNCGRADLKNADPMIDYPGFANVDNVKVPLALEPEEKQVVFGYDHQFNGTAQSSANGIIGYTIGGNDKKLPVYRIHIKAPNGKDMVRFLLPQNPNRRPGGQNTALSNPAKKARQGEGILYIKDGLDAKSGNKNILYKIVNNKLYKCAQ